MQPCLKQLTRCVIEREDGRRFEATNLCEVDGLDVCPRVTAECPTGEGYELCGSTHAEANAALLAADSADSPGTVYGHTWLCGPCQWALTEVNVRTFVVYFGKHIDAIESAIRADPQAPVDASEGLLGRINDARVYLELLACLLTEQGLLSP